MSVRVVARIRPLLKHELDKDAIVTAAPSTDGDCKSRPTIVRLPNPKNFAESFSFQFSSVFEQDATQQEIFDAESKSRAPTLGDDTAYICKVSPTVKHLFNGLYACPTLPRRRDC